MFIQFYKTTKNLSLSLIFLGILNPTYAVSPPMDIASLIIPTPPEENFFVEPPLAVPASLTLLQGSDFSHAMDLEPTFPSIFIQNAFPSALLITNQGRTFNRFSLPTRQFNCSLFGIFGRDVQRQEVVNQLLARALGNDALALHVRALMAEDIFAAIIANEHLPDTLEQLRGPQFRQLAGTYWGAHEPDAARQEILRILQQPDIFIDYVRFFIGGRVDFGKLFNDNSEDTAFYNMLTFSRTASNETTLGSALAAIAALNGLSLRVFQENNGLLEEIYFYQNRLNPQARVVTLLYNGHNHFDLLEEAGQPPPVLLENNQIELYAQQRLSEIKKLRLDLEDIKKIVILKLQTLKFRQDKPILQQILITFFQRHLSNIEANRPLNFKDIEEAFYLVLNKQIIADLHLFLSEKNCYEDLKNKIAILKLKSEDIDIQEFLKEWNADFCKQWKTIIKEIKRRNKKINGEEMIPDLLDRFKKGDKIYFHECLKQKLYTLIQLLIASSKDSNNVIENINNVLCMTAEIGDLRTIRVLIAAGANVNFIMPQLHVTALYLAAQEGHSEVVDVLIQAGANVHYVLPRNGTTALSMAAEEGYLKVLKLLIAAGADVNHVMPDGATLLIVSAQNGHKEIVSLLIRAGASINHKKQDGGTALIVATQDRHTEIVDLLIRAGADVNYAAQNGGTALMFASQDGYAKIVDLLINAGTNIDAKAEKTKGMTALMFAAQNGHIEIVDLLIRAGANINSTAQYGSTALMFAARNGHTKIVNSLIGEDAKTNCAAQNGNIALILAALNGHVEIVKLLIRKGTDVNHATQNGATPLLFAVRNNNYNMAQILLEHGANMHAKDHRGLSPFKLSCRSKKSKIKKLFLMPPLLAQTLPNLATREGIQELVGNQEPHKDQSRINDLTTEYRFTEEDETAFTELEVDIEIDSMSYAKEWDVKLEQHYQDLWKQDRINKKSKKSQQPDNKPQTSLKRKLTHQLSGKYLKLRKGLEEILIQQPHDVHNDIVKNVIEMLGGEIEQWKGNSYRIYLKDQKGKHKYIGSYEVKHDKDPKNCLTQGYLKRVATIILRAVQYNLVDPELLVYFPEGWEMPNPIKKDETKKLDKN